MQVRTANPSGVADRVGNLCIDITTFLLFAPTLPTAPMTAAQLTRLMQYRKDYDLDRDEVHQLYKVMGTMQEFVVLELILERKGKERKVKDFYAK